MSETQKQRLVDVGRHISVAATLASTLIGLISLLLAFLWFFAGNEVSDAVQEFTGVKSINSQIGVLSDQVKMNNDAITRITPKPKVAEYDKLRSKVFTPCDAGSTCAYQIRVKRTEFGRSCETPRVLGRIVIDNAGGFNAVDAGPSSSVIKMTEEWGTVRSSFIIPGDVPKGVAEFMMTLRYLCDNPGNPEVRVIIEEDTIKLPFMII